MTDEQLDLVFGALADPTRRAIVQQLAGGERSVKDLHLPEVKSAPALTKHLHVLERAGLISRGRRAQHRPCKLEAAQLQQATDWMAQYRHLWEGRLDRLEAYLQQLQNAAPPPDAPAAPKSDSPSK